MHIGFWIGWGYLILVVALSPRASFITKLLKIKTIKVIETRAAPKIIVFGGAQNWRKKWQKYCNLSPARNYNLWRGPKLKIKHDRSIEPDKKKTSFWWNQPKVVILGWCPKLKIKTNKNIEIWVQIPKFPQLLSEFLSPHLHQPWLSAGVQNYACTSLQLSKIHAVVFHMHVHFFDASTGNEQ